MARTSSAKGKQPVIKCESVYKIFGENADRMMREANGKVDVEAFENAGCIFGVNSASFEVHEGEMLVVMGLSCSGKSTLLRCISRLTDTTSGNIFIDGENLLEMNAKELIELISVRDSDATGNFEIRIQGNLIHSKRTLKHGFL